MTGTDPTADLKQIAAAYDAVKDSYDEGGNRLSDVGAVSALCLELIASHSTEHAQGHLTRDGKRKEYLVFKRNTGSKNISRPALKGHFIQDVGEFRKAWGEFVTATKPGTKKVDYEKVDEVVYTAILAFACAYDLVKPTSRKTPGTYFEVVIGIILTLVSGREREKQVNLPGKKYKVPTDIFLLGKKGEPHLVIPTKITTRERIVQAWAHQRILENVFGIGNYKSILIAASEMQRDRDVGVKEICVPNQVGMFQEHLAEMSGMYYLDPPFGYLNAEFAKTLPVRTFGKLLKDDLQTLI